MYGVRHYITEEFPELCQTIKTLKHKDQRFARLLTEYDSTDKRIYGLEQQGLPVADHYFDQLKRRRIRLKDKIYHQLHNTE